MNKRVTRSFGLLLFIALLLAACAISPSETAVAGSTATTTPDLCSADNIKGEIEKVNHLMREFDDASTLASNTARSELRPAIAELQRIRRDAEDLKAPACLSDLKKYQLAHMNLTINTLIGLMGNSDPATIMDGINRARQLHDVYTLEIARLLGITLAPVTRTSTAAGTPAAGAATQAPVTTVP